MESLSHELAARGSAFASAPARERPGAAERLSPFHTTRVKILSRLARHVPVGLRRLETTRPMVSFTFDDAADSSGDEGAALLEPYGYRATYYISSGFATPGVFPYPLICRDRIRELHRSGHEIGLHSHKHIPGGGLTAEEFQRDIDQNREWLRSIDESIEPTNFAYPHGLASYPRKLQLRDMVNSSRGIVPGVISGMFDSHHLRSVELADAKLTVESLRRYLDEVVRANGWLIFCSHDIADAPTPYGCTLSLFKRALEGVAKRDIAVVTVAEALKRSKPLGKRKFA